jgi:DNA-binding response OmpR family regulator
MKTPARLLIVDDEPNIRLMFRTALASGDYSISTAEDGKTALDLLESELFDLVTLDLRMPGMGGMEILWRLRESGNDIPVVIVTAHGSIADAVQAMKLGAVDFIAKPVHPETLRRVIAEVLERHVQPSPASLAPDKSRTVPGVTIAPAAVELTAAKRALNRREFAKAEQLLRTATGLDPQSAEAQNLLGVLHESLGEDHAAYRCYTAALNIDSCFTPALVNLSRYCERQGLDFTSKAINPAAQD